jgi:hypothetical protein
MADDHTPESLRGRVGSCIRTLAVTEDIYVYQNRISNMYQMFMLQSGRWEWICGGRMQSFRNLVPLLRRLGVEVTTEGTDP